MVKHEVACTRPWVQHPYYGAAAATGRAGL